MNRLILLSLLVFTPHLALAQEPENLLSPEESAACLAAGGYLGYGMGPAQICISPTEDAGKACASNADCTGFCLAETATCTEWSPAFGCHEVLIGDGQSAMLCVD